MEPTQVARLLKGAAHDRDIYSASERAAAMLARRLAHEFNVSAEVEWLGRVWQCRFLRDGEVLASGSGASWPVSVCRAAANLRPA